jgi:DNA-directed RNA polymerase subunit RPC12/RpoP
MAKSLLESAGIACYLRDENTIRIEWGWSNLMGGIRLQVPVADHSTAEAILAQPIPESIAMEGDSDYQQPRCPRCNSLDILHESTSQKVGAASWLVLGFPIAISKDEWKCHTCGAAWKDVTDGEEGL